MPNEFVARNGVIALNNSVITGSLNVTSGITGSLLGTASNATQAISASFATTASFYGGSVTSASYAATASNVQGGAANYISLFNTATTLSSSVMYQLSGNVGIGTTSPLSKFQVYDTTAFTYSAAPNVSAKIGASGTGGSFLVNTPSANSSYESGLAIDGTYTSGKSVININAFGVYSGGTYSADLAFKTSTNTTLSEKMRLNNVGNLGLGITPTTSTAGIFIQFGAGAALNTNSTNNSNFWHNTTFDASGNALYAVTGQQSSLYRQINGQHQWFYAAAGTAGNAITFTQQMTLDASGNLGIGTATPNAKLDISGSTIITGSLNVSAGITGSLFGTASFAQNVTSASFATTASYVLNAVSASFASTASSVNTLNQNVIISGSLTVFTGSAVEFQVTNTGTKIGNIITDTHTVTGSLNISGSENVRGSGSAVFSVDGTSGRLFQVDDSLSGSLFSVNTAGGLPVIEAFSDNTVRIGQYGQKALFVSQSRVGIGKETSLNATLDVSGSATITDSRNVLGSITTTGTLTAQTLVVQTITSSVSFITGSTQFGSLLANTHQFTGSVSMTGSLTTVGTASFNDNVGIGTTLPSKKLSISGSSNSGIFLKQGSQIQTAVGAGDFYSGLVFENTSTTNAWSLGYSQAANFSINYFDASSTYSRYVTVTSTGGNVGIGIASPSEKLHVIGNALISGSINISGSGVQVPLQVSSGSTSLLFVSQSGNVGIGTSSPISKLQVIKGSQSNTISVANSAAYIYGADVGIAIGQDNGAGGYGTWIQSMRLSDNASFPMSLNANGGNVGIGTINPAYKLDVSGSARVQGGLVAPLLFNRITTTYTLVLTDQGKMIEADFSTNIVITVPLNSNVAFPIGTEIAFVKRGSGNAQIIGESGFAGAVTVNSVSGLYTLKDQYGAASLVKVDTNEWYLYGNLL